MSTDKHIENPAEWGGHQLGLVARAIAGITHAINGREELRHTDVLPEVQKITFADLKYALARGVDDLKAYRSDVLFVCIFYPFAGLLLAQLAFGYSLIQLVFPLMSGFALLGPAAAIGLYEMSRRREEGEEANWADAFKVYKSSAFGATFVLGLFLTAVYVLWMIAANYIYDVTMGPELPASLSSFISDVFGTSEGQLMIVVGTLVGFVFAVAVLISAVVSFPMLLDRDVGVYRAVATSVRVAQKNPVTIAIWGLVIVAGLGLGFLPLALGLVITIPVLGHATWHLYRRAVVHS